MAVNKIRQHKALISCIKQNKNGNAVRENGHFIIIIEPDGQNQEN